MNAFTTLLEIQGEPFLLGGEPHIQVWNALYGTKKRLVSKGPCFIFKL